MRVLKRELACAPRTASPEVAQHNRMRILECLIDVGPLSRVEIARLTRMAPATVNRLTSSLMAQGLVSEAGSNGATGGRPSMLVRFCPEARTILALDIWEGAIEVALLDLDGCEIERDRVPILGTDPQEKLDLLVAVVAEWDAREGERIAAIGVSVPGPVDDDGVVLMAPALDWYNQPVGASLRGATNAPVVVENDVNLIALAEYLNLDDPGHKTLVAMAVYEGVGAGIVEDGRLWRGNHGAAGQFGRMLRDVSGLKHQRHGFGHLEAELGEHGLLQRAINARVVSPEVESADAVFSAAEEGDEEAVAMVESVADDYAFHLVNVCAMIAPDIVVFGGLFERWSDLLIPMFEERLRGNVVHEPELATASLGDEGKLVGAGLYGLRRSGGLAAVLSE